MAVGRLQAALAAATNEVTVAAANINFDFTLVKVEAPKEYAGLGNILSAKRKDNAEHGSSHILARQLGALFEGVCPATPKLLEAYGNRASEIAKASKIESGPYINTMFGEYTGIDGTSIWAAATSAKSAIHVHLLATLLARIWTAPEAIAIWMELVTGRKQEIAGRFDNGEPLEYPLLAAVRQDISRSQLAAWDASARAWLRTADDVFRIKQKQLELILKNFNIPVGGDLKVFPGVVEAWVVAIETIDKLISGMPQAVQNGAAFLGLSAWHLYPDMSIFSPRMVEIKMNDPLVARGGIISLGLSTTPRNREESNGVYWSLSLAQLRYYGRPVKVEKALEAGDRVTFSQLSLIIFAALLSEWKLNDSEGDLATKIVIALVDSIMTLPQGSVIDKRFLKLIRDGATAYVERTSVDQDLGRKLIQLGRRRAHTLIHGDDRTREDDESAFFFGLIEPKIFMTLFRNVESRITYLRCAALRLAREQTPPDEFIIRYVQQIGKHQRNGPQDEEILDTKTTLSTVNGIEEHAYLNISDGRSNYWYRPKDMPIHHDFAFATALPHPNGHSNGQFHRRWETSNPQGDTDTGAEIMTSDAKKIFNSWMDHVQISTAIASEPFTYYYTLGDLDEAALFSRGALARDFVGGKTNQSAAEAIEEESEYRSNTSITLEDFSWCIEHNLLCPTKIFEGLLHSRHTESRMHKTLTLLSYAAKVYDSMPNVTVDVGVLKKSIMERQWAQKQIYRPQDLQALPDLRIIFSLIAFFESGTHDVSVDQLENVIALSSTNSIFFSKPLLQDPYQSIQEFPTVERILGNIGKPGIVFLLPPQEPMVRKDSTENWKVASYLPFDGKPAASFENTSVHLSFTDYHVPIYDGLRGARDNQISFLESLISVQDRGEWVADVDPLFILKTRTAQVWEQIHILSVQSPCRHAENLNSNKDITAVDSWDELLDKPEGVFVIRTGKNWVARLATTLVIYQRMRENHINFPITVCPDKVGAEKARSLGWPVVVEDKRS